MKKILFDKIDGTEVYCYVLENEYLAVTVCELGATVLSVVVKNTLLGDIDVALGYTTAADLLSSSPYMGATIGRCANRIKDGKFKLNGKEFQLETNDNGNHLHGGNGGFDKKLFTPTRTGVNSVTFWLLSRDGDEGYPANVDFYVTFALERDSLSITYNATADGDTLFNPTNHTYFNLDGESDGSILNNRLTIFADKYTPVDATLVPTGQMKNVSGAFDFRTEKAIGEHINADDPQLKIAGGYDHNFCVKRGLVAQARGEKSGILMSVLTDRCGLQFYSGNFLSGNNGKSRYRARSGFCLETQCYPDAINHFNFGDSPVLKQGRKFTSVTSYKFELYK
jgi:aldose 1-epimerase